VSRSGIGLKPIIALYMFVVTGLLAAGLVYTAVRLSRHGLVMEQIRYERDFLGGVSARLSRSCPEPSRPESCPLSEMLNRLDRDQASLMSLSVVDAAGRLLATSDPAIRAESLWGVFGSRTAGGGPGEDWSVFERDGKRVLLVSVPLGERGSSLNGSFRLETIDKVVTRISFSLTLYAILLGVVMALAGWVLLHRLVIRPLDRLLQSADRISEGDLSFLMSAQSGSEVGRLGTSLSRMASRIEEGQQRLRDQIEELKRLNQELHQAQQGLIRSEKLASVGKLAAGVAHEVGNPISAILGYVGMLRTEEIPPDEQQDIMARVEKEVERIDTVIKDLLAYSRPGRSHVVMVPPAELVENAMALIRPQKKFKVIECEVEVPGDLPMVRADCDLVRQVLVNLMLNTLDVVQTGQHVWLRVTALDIDEEGTLNWNGAPEEPPFFELGDLHRIQPPRGGKDLIVGSPVVVFSVVDDGEGIAEEDMVRIFDPFFTTKDPGQGTGLGLAICHSAVAAMGGEIWAYSRPGKGSQLAFFLPTGE
jgi:two-component system, NtrC family, sensor kinase